MAEDSTTSEALADPDERLGLILKATVTAFEGNPAQPLMFIRTWESNNVVRHPCWPLDPEVGVMPHDLQQLEELDLIPKDSEFFVPTLRGRAVAGDPVGYLERIARDTDDEGEQSRLRGLAERLRVGDVVVGSTAANVGLVIRGLIMSI